MARTRRLPYRRCSSCRIRRTHAKGGICLTCRAPGDLPEVRHHNGAIHLGTLVLSPESAIKLADMIVDTIENERETT